MHIHPFRNVCVWLKHKKIILSNYIFCSALHKIVIIWRNDANICIITWIKWISIHLFVCLVGRSCHTVILLLFLTYVHLSLHYIKRPTHLRKWLIQFSMKYNFGRKISFWRRIIVQHNFIRAMHAKRNVWSQMGIAKYPLHTHTSIYYIRRIYRTHTHEHCHRTTNCSIVMNMVDVIHLLTVAFSPFKAYVFFFVSSVCARVYAIVESLSFNFSCSFIFIFSDLKVTEFEWKRVLAFLFTFFFSLFLNVSVNLYGVNALSRTQRSHT